jgi:hypothetical protein
MSLEDLKHEWKKEMDRSISPAELDDLMRVAQGRCSEMERQIHGRDLREILACALVIGLFAASLPACRSSPVALSGAALIIGGAALIIYVLMSARAPVLTSFETSVLECARTRLAWVDRQIGLLRNIVWWYVTPICLGCLLFGWGLTGGSTLAFGLHAAVVLAVAAGIVYLNQRAVRQCLEPVRDELSSLIENLERTAED